MIHKIITLLHTLKYLKLVQIKYQVWYRLKAKLGIKNKGTVSYNEVLDKPFVHYIHNNESYLGNNSFQFINIKQQFDKIDWNYATHAKLWTYNLNYFDFLNQKLMEKEQGENLLHQFIVDYEQVKDGKEPYPTSLRIINTIKFALANDINDAIINGLIASDTYRLERNLEYHLLANHLLENAFALFMAGRYLKNSSLKKRGNKLLLEQLNEQILEDGAHYELSPMYHQLMLYRVLDCMQIASKEDSIYAKLEVFASKMLAWLRQVTFRNGDIPLVNDAANGINPTSTGIFAYAEKMGVQSYDLPLRDSGYRMIRKPSYEILIDVGNIQPSYQPGHAHADTFSFVLHKDNKPFIVDTGTSTYNIGKRRSLERSTQAHNTVVVNGQNSSQVWAGFRVAKRAKVTMNVDNKEIVIAQHSGYTSSHTREWQFQENKLTIKDEVGKDVASACFLHFHPSVDILKVEKEKVQTDKGDIILQNAEVVTVADYQYAPQFNILTPAKKLEIQFKKCLTTKFVL